jgi:hypothetical protein
MWIFILSLSYEVIPNALFEIEVDQLLSLCIIIEVLSVQTPVLNMIDGWFVMTSPNKNYILTFDSYSSYIFLRWNQRPMGVVFFKVTFLFFLKKAFKEVIWIHLSVHFYLGLGFGWVGPIQIL